MRDVDFAIGDVATTPKAKASSEAKRLVKIFSNEGVADMYRANGLGEAEAKRATSAFKLETSRVKFDQRPKAELEPPDFNQPLPLSVNRAGHFNVEGPQSDAQVHRMLAQVAVNRGMPADNIPKLNFAHCPLDYRVEFDVTVAGFGCPSGEAAADGEFGRQYVAYVYKFAQLEDPPVEVPDSIQVSDCRPPAEGSERETQSLTVSFNVKRESETTNPSAAAHRILSLFSADNVRQHAADVGVSAHALHDMDLDATATAPRTRLTLDPDSRPCTLGEVVFDGKIPEGLQQPKYVSSRQQNGGAPAANRSPPSRTRSREGRRCSSSSRARCPGDSKPRRAARPPTRRRRQVEERTNRRPAARGGGGGDDDAHRGGGDDDAHRGGCDDDDARCGDCGDDCARSCGDGDDCARGRCGDDRACGGGDSDDCARDGGRRLCPRRRRRLCPLRLRRRRRLCPLRRRRRLCPRRPRRPRRER